MILMMSLVCALKCAGKLIASYTHLVAVVPLFRISLSLPIAFPYLALCCGDLIVEKLKLWMLHLTTCLGEYGNCQGDAILASCIALQGLTEFITLLLDFVSPSSIELPPLLPTQLYVLSTLGQVVTATGYSLMYRTKYLKQYSEDDYLRAQYIRDIRLGHLFFDTRDSTHDIVYSVCCD